MENGSGGMRMVNVGGMDGTRMGKWMENGRGGGMTRMRKKTESAMDMDNLGAMDGTRMGKRKENGCGVIRVDIGTKMNGKMGLWFRVYKLRKKFKERKRKEFSKKANAKT